ncbi:MAG TPA: hypothetical protein PLO23_09890 [Alphaproteobacteria bacterium]|nr:hypothetical protein [Alphaproteobacteria bacterium]
MESEGGFSREKVLSGEIGGGFSVGNRRKDGHVPFRYHSARKTYRYKQIFKCSECIKKSESLGWSGCLGLILISFFLMGIIGHATGIIKEEAQPAIKSKVSETTQSSGDSYSVIEYGPTEAFLITHAVVREMPDEGASTVVTMPKGSEVVVIGQSTDELWFQIEARTQVGDISGFVKNTSVAIFQNR